MTKLFINLRAAAQGLFFLLVLFASSPVPAELFGEDFVDGILDDTRWQLDRKKGCAMEVVNERFRTTPASLKIHAMPGTRCEIEPRIYETLWAKQFREPYGEIRWYGFSVYLPEGSPFTDEKNEVVAQWHSSRDFFLGEDGGRGPPLALRIVDGRWRITYGWDKDFVSTPGPKAIWPLWSGVVETGRWIDWLFRVRWSYEDDGMIEIWKDGVKIVSHNGPNAYNDIRGNYIKLGSYHPRVERVLYLDAIRIGDNTETLETMALKPGSNRN